MKLVFELLEEVRSEGGKRERGGEERRERKGNREKGKKMGGGRKGIHPFLEPLAGHTHHFSSWYKNFTIKVESSRDTCPLSQIASETI